MQAQGSLSHESTRALAQIRQSVREGGKTVFVSGNFNILHPGHTRLLSFAAECGDYLVVGVNGQTETASLLPADLRLESVRSIGFVDHAFILRDSPDAFAAALRPDIIVKGKEFEHSLNPEQGVVDAYGGRLLFSSGEATFSSIELIRREFSEVHTSTIVKPLDYPERHGFSLADLERLLYAMQGLRVTVIGDLIVDEYIACDPLGMSQEDPTIVVTPVLNERFVGGAGIVAAHARGLGAQVRFLSVVGADVVAEFATERLESFQVTPILFQDETRPTTLKQRFRANGKTLLRVSHLRQHVITHELQRRMFAAFKTAVHDTDLVVFSDFNYGCLPQSLVDECVAICRSRGVRMVADSQSSSQVGDVSRFRGMCLIKPTEREARLALRDFDSGLATLAHALAKKANAGHVVLTLGQEGLLIHAPTDDGEWITDRLPAFNHAAKDTAGAGDSLLTCASLALAAGGGIWRSVYLGSLAAACQVGRVGNLPLSTAEIRAEISCGDLR